ncbi:MAG: alpha/beta fold hydrolase [Cyanobacteria bacterium]|jgi:4,5:9,10-diseco-3-hydroxy-5,9,17-trioxoandrosta-1(10),2-diene-4-oate hydrolase|nr:alpha/beta fold hydrolase [Cyanobacteria bacterium GSL.Bin1]
MMEIKPPPDQYAQVNSINTRYWSLGDQGSTVILLHGGGASVEFWWYNVDALAQFHRVCAVDMVGSGRSDQPFASYSLSDQAQFIKDFMDTCNIRCASLVGNSMGGGVALQFALMFPDRLEKLVLVNSFGLGKQIEIFSRLGTLPFIDKFSRVFRPNRPSVAWLLKSVVYDPSVITDEWFERIYQLAVLPGALSSLVRLSRANLNLLGVRSRVFRPIVHQLSQITAPTLVIWGKHDPVLPVAHADVAAQGLANARLHIFECCGHFPQIEHPEEFNQLILEFLD